MKVGGTFSNNVGRRAHATFAGKAPEADSVSGIITVPEVAHDTEESEYVVCSLCRVPNFLMNLLTRQWPSST